MRFILGVIVGAALVTGSAYFHDTGQLKFGPPQQLVNWDVVLQMVGTIGR